MRYEETHRTFLQAIMHAGIMSDYDLQQQVATVFNYKNSALFYIGMMNTRLEPLGMMIKSANCEFTGQKYWMLMSTTVDNVIQTLSQFSQAQMELMRKIFQEIITSEDGRVSSLDSLNQILENHLSKAAREEFLNDMVRRMWLNSKEGYYYMGVRSVIELMPYFRVTYEEGFNNCPLCKQAVFHGQRCEGCQVVAHLYCLANYARIQKPLKCSNCSKVIPTDNLPEAREPMMNQDESIADQDFSQKRKKTSKRSRNHH